MAARTLFSIAGIANLSVALGLMLFRGALAPLLALDPITGTNLVWFYLTASFIGIFGYSYLRIARDPVRFRDFIGVGATGKLIAVAITTTAWLAGVVSWPLPLLISGDLVFAWLFLDFLRRTRPA